MFLILAKNSITFIFMGCSILKSTPNEMDIQFGTDFMICWLLWLYVFNTFTAVSTFCWNTELLVYFYISLLFLFQICIHYTCITCTCIAQSFYNSQLKSFWNVYRNSWQIGRRCSANNSKANYYHMSLHKTLYLHWLIRASCNGLVYTGA